MKAKLAELLKAFGVQIFLTFLVAATLFALLMRDWVLLGLCLAATAVYFLWPSQSDD